MGDQRKSAWKSRALAAEPTPAHVRALLMGGNPVVFPEAWNARARTVPAAAIVAVIEQPSGSCRVPILLANAVIDGPLDLSHCTFECDVWAAGCTFTAEVDLSFATFERTACFDGAHFQGASQLRAAHCQGDLELRDAVFSGAANFALLSVDKNLEAQGARFEGDTVFESARIQGDVLTSAGGRGGRFLKPTVWTAAVIEGQVDFSGAEFEMNAGFDLVNASLGMVFSPVEDQGASAAQFRGDVSFIGASVGRFLDFGGARFAGSATFDGLVVEGDLRCGSYGPSRAVVFEGEARFPDVRISGQADFEVAAFRGEALFRQATFQGEAFFGGSVFEKKATFNGCSFHAPARFVTRARSSPAHFRSEASFRSATFSGPADFFKVDFAGAADFEGARFSAVSDFQQARFGASASFTSIKSERDLLFQDCVFEGAAAFRDATAATVSFRDAISREAPAGSQRQFRGNVDLRGFAYERVYVAWGELLERLEPFDKQPYAQMERSLRLVGKDRAAEDVYLSQRHRTLKYRWRNFGKHWAGALLDAIYLLVANFGVRPYQLLAVPLIVLLAGTWLFSEPGAVAPKKDSGQCARQLTAGEAAAVSLNLFIPVEIPMGDAWKASEKWSPLGMTYAASATVVKLSGWIFVPLLVAWLTGLLRVKSEPS